MFNNIHQLYFLDYCRNSEGVDDPNVFYILLQEDTINVFCRDLIAETYLPNEYEGYKVIFTLVE